MSVPALQCAEMSDQFGLGIGIDRAIADHGGEAGEAVDAMRINAVASCLGKKPRTHLRTRLGESELAEDGCELLFDFFEGDSIHGALRAGEIQHIPRRQTRIV